VLHRDRVRVQVSRVDLDGRKIDFRMVREGEAERLLSRGQRDKAGAGRGAADDLAAVREQARAERSAARARVAGVAPSARKTTRSASAKAATQRPRKR